VSIAAGPELTFTKCHEVITPRSSRLASAVINAAGRKQAHVNSSSRVQRRDTGRWAAWASRAASMAASPVCLPPKPLPKSGTTTRTWSLDKRNVRASSP
jgi:hypothetical protein